MRPLIKCTFYHFFLNFAFPDPSPRTDDSDARTAIRLPGDRAPGRRRSRARDVLSSARRRARGGGASRRRATRADDGEATAGAIDARDARERRARERRATRDARRATNGDRIEARARGLTFLGDDGDDDDARDARLRRRRRRSTATIVSALDVEVDDDGRGARAVERARRWVPMAQVRAKEHQGIVVSAVVLPVHGARVSGEEEDGIATRE